MKTIRIGHPFQRTEVLSIPGVVTLRTSHDVDGSGVVRKDYGCYGVVVCVDGDFTRIAAALGGVAQPPLLGRVPTTAQRNAALETMERLE